MSARRAAPRPAPRAVLTVDSPVGQLVIEADAEGVRAVGFGPVKASSSSGEARDSRDVEVPSAARAIAQRAASELADYFRGERREFTVPIAPIGTRFQARVWRALRRIPYGETRSYGEIARAIGHRRAARAIGAANHVNPIAVIVPCHRVIGADRALVGYGGGLDKKEWLLRHEAQHALPAGRKVAAASAAR